jgi:cell division protein FtsI/penicillin-binding protein 2
VRCRGYDDQLRVSCAHGKAHGRIGLEDALEASCNIYFANKAVELGQKALRSMATRLGLNGEGVLLTPGLPGVEMRSGVSTALAIDEVLRDKDLARVGYGQGPVSATVFDIARMGAVIAAGGTFHEPRLVRAYGFSTETENEERDRSTLRELPTQPEREVLPRAVAEKLREYSRRVFAGPHGTARGLENLWLGPGGYELAARSPGEDYQQIPVAGKTGSAWRTRYDTMDDAWMLAWTPAESPRVLVSVMLRDAGEGGKVAGPVAMELLRTALQALEEREVRE